MNLCPCRMCMQKRTHGYVKYPHGYVKCISIFCSIFYFISYYVFCGRGSVQEIFGSLESQFRASFGINLRDGEVLLPFRAQK